ncbi:MAG: hypothetical protein ACRC8W_13895 [Plesiomonas shigelloides]
MVILQLMTCKLLKYICIYLCRPNNDDTFTPSSVACCPHVASHGGQCPCQPLCPQRRALRWLSRATSCPNPSSTAFVVANHKTSKVISERNGSRVMPIASLTKLMTALVVLGANQRLNEMLTVTNAYIDRIKGTGSRLAASAPSSKR